MRRLEGRFAVVTGAAGGIGRAICHRFAHEGARVAALDLVAPDCGDVRLTCDLGNDRSVAEAAHAVLATGRPDILVHAAAASAFGGTLDTPSSTFADLHNVNVGGAVRLVQGYADALKASGSGAIVFVSSINADYATPTLSAYAASKAALNGLTRTLALELADHRVRVNAIAPASIDTPLLHASFERHASPDEALVANIRRHPLGRLGTPLDIANLALFLASDEASWITGQIVGVDGGAGVTRR